MRGVGIITDASAQFLSPNFTGNDRVHTLPLHIHWQGQSFSPHQSDLQHALPTSLLHHSEPPTLQTPSVSEIVSFLTPLIPYYDGLLLLPMSNSTTPLFQTAVQAANQVTKGYPIYVVDTQTFGIGLGWLVQAAAQMASSGASIFEILSHVRNMVSRIYTTMCVQSLTYLYHSGFLDPAQAIIGEMLDLCPIFVLEEGRLAPLHKARSPRHLLDLLQEFTNEFNALQSIVIAHHPHHFHREANNLRDRLSNDGKQRLVQITQTDSVTTTLFGPRALHLFILAAT